MAVLSGITSISGLTKFKPNQNTADVNTWTLCVIPDTQRLAANNATAYNTLMQWVVDNQVTEDIQMTIHLGDVVNTGGNSTQWTNVETAMDRLQTNNVPFLMTAGNWDYDSGNSDANRTTTTYWESAFPHSYWSGKSWHVESYQNITTNQCGKITIGDVRYLFLTLEVWARPQVLSWADRMISENAADRIIVATHGLTTPDGSFEPDSGGTENGGQGGGPDAYGICGNSADGDCSSGEEIRDNFLNKHENIILTMNGHDVASSSVGNGISGDTAFSKTTNVVNSKTNNVHLFNYQNASGNTYEDSAYLRLYKFDHADNSCDVTTYNPVRDTNLTDSENQFTFTYS